MAHPRFYLGLNPCYIPVISLLSPCYIRVLYGTRPKTVEKRQRSCGPPGGIGPTSEGDAADNSPHTGVQ